MDSGASCPGSLYGEWIKAYENWTQARRVVAQLLFRDCHSPRSRTAVSPKLFVFRAAGTQVSPVTMSHPSPRASTPPCLLLFIKEPLKKGRRVFLGFGLGFGFGLFGVGSFWKGKELLKGK
jgi:hypothetical protein